MWKSVLGEEHHQHNPEQQRQPQRQNDGDPASQNFGKNGNEDKPKRRKECDFAKCDRIKQEQQDQ